MTSPFSRLFLAGGHNAVPLAGWFLGGWSSGTTLALFWFENLLLTLFIAVRVAAHWRATRKRGHEKGFLTNFLVVSIGFTVGHGVFLALVLGLLLPDSVNRADLLSGVQWMLAAQTASLVLDLWFLAGWPFAEIRARTNWMLGRVVMVHLSVLLGMFLYAAMDQPWWFFSVFVTLKALLDISGLLPRWQPKESPAWLSSAMDSIGPAHPSKETFAEYWRRQSKQEADADARDEEELDA